MTTKTKCACEPRGLCHYDALTRTKFFHGMLLTDEHLRAEQTYHRESLKRLNRHLWGAGIVCGLEVRKVSKEKGLCIKVQPGMALDCDGNVIDVCKSLTVDLSQVCKEAYPDGCAPEDVKPITKYLVIRYVEIAADPQPVLAPDDECTPPGGGTKCEGSKYREGFCLDFVDKCPDCPVCGKEDEKDYGEGLLATFLQLETSAESDEAVAEELEKRTPDCMDAPPCSDCDCKDAAVGLAKVVIDCAENTVKVYCDCRRYIWSPRLIQWFICGLFSKLDKLSTNRTGLKRHLPKASEFIANPLRTAWDVGGLALRSRGVNRLAREVGLAKSRKP